MSRHGWQLTAWYVLGIVWIFSASADSWQGRYAHASFDMAWACFAELRIQALSGARPKQGDQP